MEIFYFILLGAFTGLFAGMLGIGGGAFVVPTLVIIFASKSNSFDIRYAIATSLCIMVFTSMASSFSHFKKNHVDFKIAKFLIPFIILGTIFGVYFASIINPKALSLFFALFLLFVSFEMFFKVDFKTKKIKISKNIQAIIGVIIGVKSGLLGVGAGSISVPFLRYLSLSMKKAIGTTAFFTFVISIIGTSTFMFFVKSKGSSFGYIYLPALFTVAPVGMFFAYLGAKLTNVIPNKILSRIFALILFILSSKMLFNFFFS